MHPVISLLQSYKKLLIVLLGGVVVAVGGLRFWQHRQGRQDQLAQNEIFEAVYHFEVGAYDKALEGDGTYPGFLKILTSYKHTKTANLACLYAGICCIHQARYQEAIQYLSLFKANDCILQARAWSLMGDAYVEQKSYEEAITYYLKAAHHKPNQFFSPGYLIKAAIVYEAQQAYPKAMECYRTITKKYEKSSFTRQAKKEIARLKALL